MRVATILGAIGAALVATGLTLFGDPGTAAQIAGEPEAVQVIGAVTLLVAAAVAVGILRSDRRDRGELPPPDPLGDRNAGWAVDRALDRIDRQGEAGVDASSARERVRDELRAAIVDVYDDRGLDRSVATDRIDDGSWTDDPEVAALVADGKLPDPGPVRRLSLRRTGKSRTRWIAERAVREVETLATDSATERDGVPDANEGVDADERGSTAADEDAPTSDDERGVSDDERHADDEEGSADDRRATARGER